MKAMLVGALCVMMGVVPVLFFDWLNRRRR